jgi:hypothetical protein
MRGDSLKRKQKKPVGGAVAKPLPKRQDELARTGQQAIGKASSKAGETNMSTMTKALPTTDTVTAQLREPAEELFDPREWAALLNSFENDGSSAAPAATGDDSSDDLWEKLSSTRWLRRPSGAQPSSTLTERPSA